MKNNFIVSLLLLIAMGTQAQVANHHYFIKDYSRDSVMCSSINLNLTTHDGGTLLLIGGEYNQTVSISTYGFSLIRYDENGNRLWNTFIYGDESFSTSYRNLIELPDHGFAIVGNTNGNGGGFVAKTDSLGQLIFAKNYFNQILRCISDPSDNGFLILTNKGNSHSEIIKTDASGAIVWTDSRDISANPDHYYDAQLLNNGNYLAVGVAYSDPAIVQGVAVATCYSHSGTLLWTKYYAGTDWITIFSRLKQLSDGTILVAGSTSQLTVKGNWPIIAKIDTAGNVHWCKTLGGGLGDLAGDYSFDNNSMYLGGNISGTGIPTSIPVIARFDSSGNVNWIKVYPPYDFTNGLFFGAYNGVSAKGSKLSFSYMSTFCNTDSSLAGSCFLNDTIINTVNMSLQTGTFSVPKTTVALTPVSLVRTNSTSVDYVKFDACIPPIPVGIETALYPTTADVKIYPNPATDFLTMESDNNMDYTILSTDGREVISGNKNSSQSRIDVSTLKAGIYFIRFESTSKTGYQKLIKN